MIGNGYGRRRTRQKMLSADDWKKRLTVDTGHPCRKIVRKMNKNSTFTTDGKRRKAWGRSSYAESSATTYACVASSVRDVTRDSPALHEDLSGEYFRVGSVGATSGIACDA